MRNFRFFRSCYGRWRFPDCLSAVAYARSLVLGLVPVSGFGLSLGRVLSLVFVFVSCLGLISHLGIVLSLVFVLVSCLGLVSRLGLVLSLALVLVLRLVFGLVLSLALDFRGYLGATPPGLDILDG